MSTFEDHISKASKHLKKAHQNLQAAQFSNELVYDQTQHLETLIDRSEDLIFSLDQYIHEFSKDFYDK